MSMWQQFAVVALAHFLALLSPGPDFFLIVRSALRHGWRGASGVCVGIASANGVFIVLALCGVAFVRESGALFTILKWGGCVYLAWLGWLFLRHKGEMRIDSGTTAAQAISPANWAREFVTGFLSGILNPKNSLFYASLFSLAISPATPASVQAVYGAWMFFAVLGWDLAVAAAIGHPAVVRRFIRHLRTVERVTGVVLLGIAAGVIFASR